MLHNYLKTALRNLLREKGSAFLNVAGLTLGITCSLVLFLLIRHLTSFDNYHANRDRIYRVVMDSDGNNGKFYTSGSPPALPAAFREEFPEAAEVTFMSYRAGSVVKVPQANAETKKFFEKKGVVFAQSNFFKIFDRPLFSGNASRALDEPGEAVISRSLAKKYFGREDVVGQIVMFDTVDYKVTAVMEDHPDNTDFPFDLMLSFATIQKEKEKIGWDGIWSDEQCYVLLKKGQAKSKIESRIPAFVDKYLGKDNYSHMSFSLQPLSDIHFDDRYSNYNYRTSPPEMLIALGAIAVFLIITACINFINLTTAEAITRSREVGIRKSLGSSRAQLIAQFLGETTMVTLFAVALSLGITQIALSLINPFLDLQLTLKFSSDPSLWIFVAGITICVSLLSGLYPSLVVSGYKPAQALKNQITNRSSSGYHLRRSLVVLQFFISQFFIMGTIVLLSQMNYFQKQDLGFRKAAVLIIPIPEQRSGDKSSAASSKRVLRESVTQMTGVLGASLSSTPPSSGTVSTTGFYFDGEDEGQSRGTQLKQVDEHYISLYSIPLLAGKNLQDSDTARGVLVNEELVRVSGFENPQDILGKHIHVSQKTLPVIGVIRDFHTVSLRDKIEPTILMNGIDDYRTLSMRIDQSRIKGVIDVVKNKWENAYPEHIFDYRFLDDQIREFYEGEQKMSLMLTIFTFMAIFIGCLGLFGLATFMANQKTKEIGVRKAMGASVESIIFLFSKEFIKLILIGFVFAAPAAWFLMNKWLENFAYKINIGPEVFISGLLLTLLAAVLTVGYKSFRAAIVNPIESLRYE
jgi:predicted permease